MEHVVGAGRTDGVDPCEIDDVEPGRKVGNSIMLTVGGRALAESESKIVGAACRGQPDHARTTNQLVPASASHQGSVTATALKGATQLVCDQRVVSPATY